MNLKDSLLQASDAFGVVVERLLPGPAYAALAQRVLERPIIILGTERSGTTLLYSLLTNHPALYWFSRLDELMPRAPLLTSYLRRLVHRKTGRFYALPGTTGRSKGWIPPTECITYWEHIFHTGSEFAYQRADDVFTEADLTPELRACVQTDLKKRLLILQKERLLFKQPGFSLKIRFLNALFPDALFVHCVRDPLANLQSMERMKEREGVPFWGTKVPGWREHLESPPAVQAALQLRAVYEHIERDLKHAQIGPERYEKVRYEDLLARPADVLRHVLHVVRLPYDDAVEPALAQIRDTQAGRSAKPLRAYSAVVQAAVRDVAERLGYEILVA